MTADNTGTSVDGRESEEIERAQQSHPAKKGLLFNVGITVLEIGGAILAFHLVKNAGGGDVQAYLIGSAAPVLGALVVWMRAKKFSGASAAIFAFTVLSAAVAVIGSTDPKVLLYKDCAVTAVIGLIFGGSCFLAPRPVLFYFAQRYGSDGTREGMAVYDKMWVVYPTFRKVMFQISAVWAIVFLVQAGVTALVIRATTFSTAYNYDQILPIVALVLAMGITMVLGQRAKNEGAARAAARRTAH